MNFYELKDNDKYKKLWWSDEMEFEKIPLCPKNPKGHLRGGKRIGTLKLIKKSKNFGDFNWSWLSDCIISDKVANILKENNISGYELWPVEIVNKEMPIRFWEFRTTGWSGMAQEKSGIKLDLKQSCEYCGHLRYTSLKNPKHLIDEKQWDGSDIFMVWPLPAFKFVTQKVINIIEKEKLTGFKIIPIEKLYQSNSIISGYSPGRLSYYMPEERAKLLGEPLGIY